MRSKEPSLTKRSAVIATASEIALSIHAITSALEAAGAHEDPHAQGDLARVADVIEQHATRMAEAARKLRRQING